MPSVNFPGKPRSSPKSTILDLLIIDAGDLLSIENRIRILRTVRDLIQRTTRAPHMRGPWVLILTHTPEENDLAYTMTSTLTDWCQGVRAVTVKGGDIRTTESAALAFHRLHFLDVNEQERKQRIQGVGSIVYMEEL